MKLSRFDSSEKKLWNKALTKYLQEKNGTGRSKLPRDIFASIDYFYEKYNELQEIKKSIINQLY